MTRQESFKRKVRARMAKTGEKYGSARRHLIERSNQDSQAWVSEPENSEEAVTAATGRGWDEWRVLIDDGPGPGSGHGDIAAFVQTHDVDGWWSQAVAVGYERITGIRLPHQQPDGTFTAGKSKTVSVDADQLRALILDEDSRHDLFPGLDTELRSRASAKTLRIGIGPGVAQIAMEPKSDGRVTVYTTHEKLPSPEAVAEWKAYWSEWLDAIDESAS